MIVQQAGEWPVAWGRGHSNGVETDAQIVHHFILLTQHNKPIKPVIRSLRRCVCPTSVVGLKFFYRRCHKTDSEGVYVGC